MSAGAMMVLLMAHRHNQMMMQESARRRRDEDNRRRKRAEEERKKQEEHKRMVEKRKTSPVVCNDESWQQDRCVKVISLQPSVQRLMSVVEEVRPTIIEEEEKKFDEKILETGYSYEKVRIELDSDIETLKELGISISGEQHKLTRLTPTNTHIAKIEQVTEFAGSTFTIKDGQPIRLNPMILSSTYYEDRYREMPEEAIESDYAKTTKRFRRYQAIGKYLGFLLKTEGYKELKRHSEFITREHETCELRRKEFQSFQSLDKEQLEAIKSYFDHLGKLSDISNNIKDLFYRKRKLRDESNETIYDLTIQRIMSNKEYSELIEESQEYINRIYANDEETMQEAYELVKGEYPVNVSKRFVYDLLISNLRRYQKEDIKRLKLS